MEVDGDNEVENEYRIQVGNKIKYIEIAPGTFDGDILSPPLASLPSLPYSDGKWTTAYISRDAESGELRILLSERQLGGFQNLWHSTHIDVLHLERVERLAVTAFAALICGIADPTTKATTTLPLGSKIVAKIARYGWDIPRIKRDTRVYELLEQRDPELAPRFLGHIRKGGRLIGILLEKLEGRREAEISDLHNCEVILKGFHSLGLLHGDPHRYNFLVADHGVKLIDFECSQEDTTEAAIATEMQSLQAELMDQSGRGAGFMFSDQEESVNLGGHWLLTL
jgi:hypothetical protein